MASMRHDDNHDNNFDLIRLFAALQVILSHSSEWLKLPLEPHLRWLISIFPGVPIFFTVSGFLITQSYLQSRAGIGNYFWKRSLRIYPGLWFNISILLLLCLYTKNLNQAFVSSTAFIPWLITFFISGSDYATGMLFHVSWWNSSGVFRYFPSGVLWTLSIELLFYLAVPVIFLRATRNCFVRFSFLLFFFTISVLWFFSHKRDGAPGFILDYLWIFLFGAALSVYWSKVKYFYENRVLLWAILYISVCILIHTPYYKNGTLIDFFGTLLLASFAISFAFSLTWLRRYLREDISYGLYLWHMPIIWPLTLVGWTGGWQFFLLALALTVAVAFAVRLGIEKPALRLKRLGSPPQGLSNQLPTEKIGET